jgi:hypothetical protein
MFTFFQGLRPWLHDFSPPGLSKFGHQIAIFPRFVPVGCGVLLAFDLSRYIIGGAIVEKSLAQFQGEKDCFIYIES